MLALWSSGSNAHGQLSNGTLNDSHNFKPCHFLGHPEGTLPPNTSHVLDVVSGANHTLVLLETRDKQGGRATEIWASGDGSAGQLGIAYRQFIEEGGLSTVFRPIQLQLQKLGLDGYQFKLISASWETTYVVLSRESKGDVLISMGADEFGDLGIGGKDKRKSYDKGTLHIVKFEHLTIRGMPLKDAKITVQSMTSGQRHVVAQLRATWSDDVVRTAWVGWGTSRHGQLGSVRGSDGRPVPYFSQPSLLDISDSKDHILYGALGSQHTVFLHESGRVKGLGSNRKGQLQRIENTKAVTHLGCTWNGTYVVTSKGDDKNMPYILATGSGSHGQLGRQLTSDSVATEQPSLAPVEVSIGPGSRISAMACGTEHVLILLSSGTEPDTNSQVLGWGWNEHGTLGNDSTDDVFIPVKIWPPASTEFADQSPKAVGIWAGSGTSWVATC